MKKYADDIDTSDRAKELVKDFLNKSQDSGTPDLDSIDYEIVNSIRHSLHYKLSNLDLSSLDKVISSVGSLMIYLNDGASEYLLNFPKIFYFHFVLSNLIKKIEEFMHPTDDASKKIIFNLINTLNKMIESIRNDLPIETELIDQVLNLTEIFARHKNSDVKGINPKYNIQDYLKYPSKDFRQREDKIPTLNEKYFSEIRQKGRENSFEDRYRDLSKINPRDFRFKIDISEEELKELNEKFEDKLHDFRPIGLVMKTLQKIKGLTPGQHIDSKTIDAIVDEETSLFKVDPEVLSSLKTEIKKVLLGKHKKSLNSKYDNLIKLADNFIKLAQTALSENSPLLSDVESLMFSRDTALSKVYQIINYVRSHENILKNILNVLGNKSLSKEERLNFIDNKIHYFVNHIKNKILTDDDLAIVEFNLNQKPGVWEYNLVREIISNYLTGKPDNMNTISALSIDNI